MSFAKYIVAHILAKFKYFVKQIIFNRYSTTARRICCDIWHEVERQVSYHFYSSSWSGIFVYYYMIQPKIKVLRSLNNSS